MPRSQPDLAIFVLTTDVQTKLITFPLAHARRVTSYQNNRAVTGRMAEIQESLEPLPVNRNKGPARTYFVMMVLVYLVLIIMAVVALGSFGIKQSQITRRQINLGLDRSQTCILFAEFLGTEMKDGKTVHIKKLKPPGVCGYVLWGLIS